MTDLKKTFGDITVKDSNGNCGIVEFIYNGCVICYFEARDIYGEPSSELHEVHNRLTSMDFDRETFWRALEWGRKLADVLVELKEE